MLIAVIRNSYKNKIIYVLKKPPGDLYDPHTLGVVQKDTPSMVPEADGAVDRGQWSN